MPSFVAFLSGTLFISTSSTSCISRKQNDSFNSLTDSRTELIATKWCFLQSYRRHSLVTCYKKYFAYRVQCCIYSFFCSSFITRARQYWRIVYNLQIKFQWMELFTLQVLWNLCIIYLQFHLAEALIYVPFLRATNRDSGSQKLQKLTVCLNLAPRNCPFSTHIFIQFGVSWDILIVGFHATAYLQFVPPIEPQRDQLWQNFQKVTADLSSVVQHHLSFEFPCNFEPFW